MSHEEELWGLLPTSVERAVGITALAEMVGIPVDRALRLLRGLEPHGARCCQGDLVGNVLLFNYWWRDPLNQPPRVPEAAGVATDPDDVPMDPEAFWAELRAM